MPYRKKQVVSPWRRIEAIQWTGNNVDEVRQFVDAGWESHFVDRASNYIISTPTGQIKAAAKDWIIKAQGEFYSCKPDIFAAIYEEVR